jgi:hypothetical protein
MPQVIKSVFDYLLEKKRDIYALRLYSQAGVQDMRVFFDASHELNKALQEEVLCWFEENKINVYQVYMDPGLIGGWDGVYYVDFEREDQVKAYTSKFEDGTGKSLNPKKYQMFIFSYEKWTTDENLKEIIKSTFLDISY